MVSLRGFFEKPGEGNTFQQFSEARREISNRLRNANPIYATALGANGEQTSNGYWNGYNGNQAEVLIPAFLSTYGPYRPGSVTLSPFPNIPLPNWNVTYNGLTEIPAIKQIFKAFSIRHGYRNSYTLSYNLNVNFNDPDGDGYTDRVVRVDTGFTAIGNNPLSIVNFEPRLQIQAITMTESFQPLIGVQMELKWGISAQVDYSRRRTLIFNVGALQLNESTTDELTINVSYRRQNFLPGFQLFKREINLKGQFVARFELTLRDIRNQNRSLDANVPPVPTSGNFNLTIKPSLDYSINKNVTVRAYFEYNLNRPVVSTSFPTSFTAFGVQIRFNLTQ
jgi:cell surface protein SprA